MTIATDGVKTITLHRQIDDETTSEASVTLTKRGDGSYAFTPAGGMQQVAHSNDAMRRLFEALEALE